MKKLSLLAVLALAAFAQAQKSAPAPAPAPKPAATSSAAPALPLGITAVGYDDNLKHITARISLSQNNAVDVGAGLTFDDAAATDKFQLGLSGFYLLKLQDWGVVDNYLTAGAYATIFSDSDLKLNLFAGLQPEITLLDRLILSVRFGADLGLTPDFALGTKGQPISVVNGLNFKIVW
jgi:hypothetical protein